MMIAYQMALGELSEDYIRGIINSISNNQV